MSARPLRVAQRAGGLRVLRGRRTSRTSIAPWFVMALVGVMAFLGLVFARTSLDNSAFELAELRESIEIETTINRDLRIEIARMENPARIAPLAEEMGLVVPDVTHQLLVDLDPDAPRIAQADREETQ